jgi:hypothetical protein
VAQRREHLDELLRHAHSHLGTLVFRSRLDRAGDHASDVPREAIRRFPIGERTAVDGRCRRFRVVESPLERAGNQRLIETRFELICHEARV